MKKVKVKVKVNENWEEELLLEQNAVMDTYRSRGYIINDNEANILHQSFSPMRVPKGLTKLQIRRRINYYTKHGQSSKQKQQISSILNTNRLEININGINAIGISFGGKFNNTNEELKKLLKTVIKII